ncbi:hypothetical protein ACFL47_05310 [Candidatus Latescibacterota bacterium]
MVANTEKYGKRVLDYQRVEVFLANQMVGRSRAIENNPDPKPLAVVWQQAIRFGNTVIVTFPNEVFTEIGRAVKDRSPVENTFVIGLTSGHGGYIPTREEYLEGGYAANGSGFAPECEQVVINSSLELIGKISDANIRGF